MIFTGKNTDYEAVWNCSKQSYTIYYKNRYFMTKYKFSDIQSYLN